ncbi:hypothetical protein G7K_5778-t1 [Saitoella complicata NRRL Y-17804]|uniref:Uncharacterized protein n=1 Tax=Saitoella complicata (strain BCRC 22490 / CBS 7301 / JCM 7358 / NBRC 10748 / NRRL Y-17804) TaxID=698492 RepID=A0A0E9NQI1_SAICN|nr:hypothetical protein G7K_5778-t1 [Saitoella complicata NRRL Y-17804]
MQGRSHLQNPSPLFIASAFLRGVAHISAVIVITVILTAHVAGDAVDKRCPSGFCSTLPLTSAALNTTLHQELPNAFDPTRDRPKDFPRPFGRERRYLGRPSMTLSTAHGVHRSCLTDPVPHSWKVYKRTASSPCCWFTILSQHSSLQTSPPLTSTPTAQLDMQLSTVVTALLAGVSLVSATPVPEAGAPKHQAGSSVSIIVAPNVATGINLCAQLGGKFNTQLQQCVVQQNQQTNVGTYNGGDQTNSNGGIVARSPGRHDAPPPAGPVAVVVAPNTATAADLCAQIGGKFNTQLQQCVAQQNQQSNFGTANGGSQSNSNGGIVARSPGRHDAPSANSVTIVAAPNTAAAANLCAQIGGVYNTQLQQCVAQQNQQGNFGSENGGDQSNSNSGSVGGSVGRIFLE